MRMDCFRSGDKICHIGAQMLTYLSVLKYTVSTETTENVDFINMFQNIFKSIQYYLIHILHILLSGYYMFTYLSTIL